MNADLNFTESLQASINMTNELISAVSTPTSQGSSSPFTLDSKFIQYIYILIVCSISLIFLLRFYSVTRHGYAKLSTMLRIHLYMWICCMINNVSYVFPVIYYWHKTVTFFGEQYNLFWAALRGSANSAGMIVAPLSTLFVTLDRIYTISNPLQSRTPFRLYSQLTCALILIFAFLFVTYIGFIRTYSSDKQTTTCVNYGCLLVGGAQINDLVTFKIVISYFNIVAGIIFIILYIKIGRKLSGRREQKKNYVIQLLLCGEFIFNVIPCTLYLLSFDKTISSTKINFTSILMPSYCTDGMLTSLIFYRTWSEKILKQTNAKAITPINVGGFNQNSSANSPSRIQQ